jgi:hypothetical protein
MAMACSTNCTQQVTVFPSPNINPPSAPQENCGPFNPQPFTVTYTGGASNPTFQWYSTTNSIDPGSAANPGTPLTVNPANPQTYDPPGNISVSTYYFCVISYTDVLNCESYQSGLFQAIVNTVPTVTASNDTAICSSSTASLSATGSVIDLIYNWSPATGLNNASIASPIASGLASSITYTVTVSDANNCTDTDEVTVNVSTALNANVPNVLLVLVQK